MSSNEANDTEPTEYQINAYDIEVDSQDDLDWDDDEPQIEAPTAPDARAARLDSPDADIRRAAVDELGQELDELERWIDQLAEGAVPALVAALRDPDRGIRERSAAILGRLATSPGTSSNRLGNALGELLRAPDEGNDRDARWQAWELATHLLELSGPKAAPVLVDALARHRDSYPAYRAALALAALVGGSSELLRLAVPPLIATLSRPGWGDLQSAAEHALKSLGPMLIAWQDALRDVPGAADDPSPRRRLFNLLAGLGQVSTPYLTLGLEDPDEAIRRRAAEGLGQLGAAASPHTQVLLRSATTDSDLAVRVAAALAAWRIGRCPEAVQALTDVLEAADSYELGGTVFEPTMAALAEIGPPAQSVIPALERFWQRYRVVPPDEREYSGEVEVLDNPDFEEPFIEALQEIVPSRARDERRGRYGQLETLFPRLLDWDGHRRDLMSTSIGKLEVTFDFERDLREAGLHTIGDLLNRDEAELLSIPAMDFEWLRHLKDRLYELGFLPLAAVVTLKRLEAYVEGYDEERSGYEIREWLHLSRHEFELLDATGDGALDRLREPLERDAPFSPSEQATSPFRLAQLWQHGDGIAPLLLHLAARNNDSEVTRLLLEHGAPVNALDAEHRTPLDIALGAGSEDVGSLLRAAGGIATELIEDRPSGAEPRKYN